MRFLSFTFVATTLCACASSGPDQIQGDSAEIVGGNRDTRWSAAGYLVHEGTKDFTRVDCGATLIAGDVAVTAAHCVKRWQGGWSFGTGDPGTSKLVAVREVIVHPEFHEEPRGSFDLTHALRKYDVAILLLDEEITGVTPAELPTAPPSTGCSIQAIGYHADEAGAASTRKSAPACIMFRLTLGQDPIFEVRPQNRSALCVADGDEGSPVVDRGTERTTLVGFFVGSVTQGVTDCRPGVQFLNGYESAYGYRAFFAAGIERARTTRLTH